MAALGVAKVASTVLLFATLVLGQGAEKKLECDVQGISMSYWMIGEQYGTTPLANPVPQDKKDYLNNLCHDVEAEPNFPAEPQWKKEYASCSGAEKKKFARMERGYTALRDAISAPVKCESVVLLRDCLNLDVIRNCQVFPTAGATFDENQKAKIRGSENLKKCLAQAARPCEGKQNPAAIAHLDKIAAAIVDLSSLSDGRNTASRMNAAVAVIAPFLLSFLVRGIH